MKVGDLVKVRDRGLSLAAAKRYLGHIGVVVSDTSVHNVVKVLINGKVEGFIQRYIEVINEA